MATQGSKLSKIKSISVAIAVKLGFICPEKAQEADEAVQQNPNDSPTLTLLVDKGYLDKIQAAKLKVERAKKEPLDDLQERVRAAKYAVRRAVPGSR